MALSVNECLCFVSNQCDNLNKNNLVSALDFYQIPDLSEAKELLITEFEKVGDVAQIQNFKTKRRENLPGANNKIIKDLIDIWEVVDTTLGGKLNVKFVAADINCLPSINADQFNLQFLIGAINKLQEKSQQQQDILVGVAQSLTSINERLDSTESINVFPVEGSIQTPPPFSSRGKRRLSGRKGSENPSGAKRVAAGNAYAASYAVIPLATPSLDTPSITAPSLAAPTLIASSLNSAPSSAATSDSASSNAASSNATSSNATSSNVASSNAASSNEASSNAESSDAALPDAALSDAATFDAATSDAATSDATTSDAASSDATTSDATSTDEASSQVVLTSLQVPSAALALALALAPSTTTTTIPIVR